MKLELPFLTKLPAFLGGRWICAFEEGIKDYFLELNCAVWTYQLWLLMAQSGQRSRADLKPRGGGSAIAAASSNVSLLYFKVLDASKLELALTPDLAI